MRTTVGYRFERHRKKKHLVYWFEPPGAEGKQRKRSRLFETRAEARDFQAAKQVEIGDGSTWRASPDKTLVELVEAFRKVRLPGLACETRRSYEFVFGRLLATIEPQSRLHEIDRSDAETFMAQNRLNRRGIAVSTWTQQTFLKCCRALFGLAMEWEWISANPFKAKPGTGHTGLNVRGRSQIWHHVTPAEFAALLTVVSRPQNRCFYWLQYACGLRPGEAVNVRLDNVDLPTATVTVADRPGNADMPPFTVKTSRGDGAKNRVVHIPSIAMADVAQAATLALKSGGFLSLTATQCKVVLRRWRDTVGGDGNWTHRIMLWGGSARFKKAWARAGLTASAQLTLTCLRKSFAQNHANAGTPPRTLMGLMGHSSVAMTLRFYQQMTDANERAAAATMDRVLVVGADRQAETA